MKHAIFYVMQFNNTTSNIDIEVLVCNLTELHWRNGKRILIFCEHEKQASHLDTLLWQYYSNAFLPHNLVGKGPRQGAPIEIAWPQCYNCAPYDLLINLLPKFITFSTLIHEVIDFVPYEKDLKQLARERYKVYRNLGFQLKIAKAPKSKTI